MGNVRAKHSKFVKRSSAAELRLEVLEQRHLLTADLVPDFSITSPYARDAVTVAQMEARAKLEPYVEGELLVAVAMDAANTVGPHRPLDDYLQSDGFHADNIAALNPIFMSDQSQPSAFALVKIDLAGVDTLSAMRELDAAPAVLWSSPNFIFVGEDARDLVPNDPQYGNQYHHPLEQNDDAWDITLGDASIVIGITDDGVDLQHQDLATGIWLNAGEVAGNGIDDDGNGYIDDLNGYNFLNDNNNPDALAGDDHGTHVSGIAAARTNNATGVAGVAGNSTIMPLKWYDGGTWTAAIIAETFSYAADNGAKIVNTSYNMDGWANDPVVHAAFQYMHDAGILHLNSAGNGSAMNPPRQVFEQTLLVASTESTDAKSGFSNYGTGIDLAAAGGGILSTTPNNTYSVFSGTSMATPNAAGVAALIWAQNPSWSRDQVAAQLLATADNIDAQNGAYVGLLGSGRVNSFRALTEAIPAPQVRDLIGVPNGGSLPASTIITDFEVRYDQIMDGSSVTSSSAYDLRGAGADGVFDTPDDSVFTLQVANPYYYGTNSIQLDIVGGALGIGDYRLTIQASGVSNPFGTPLDGNGDSVPGDDYRVNFSITMNGFQQIGVGGGLSKLSNSNPGVLTSDADMDAYPFFAEAGETVTAIVTPGEPSVTISAAIDGGGSATAAGPGQSVVVPLSTVASSGTQTLRVSGDGATIYAFSIYRNVNIEGLNETAAAVAIDDSYLNLGSGRLAAIGQANGSLGGVSFQQYSSAAAFIDIAGTGTPLNLTDDAEATIATTVGNSYFPAGAVTVGNNGVIAVGSNVNVDYTNTALPTSDFSAAMLPFWDDIDDDAGNVYWEERQVGGIDTLIVQWDNRPAYPNTGAATFQVQLFESGPMIARYAYRDVDFGNAQSSFGGSATVGFQIDAATGFEFSRDQASLANHDVIDVVNLPPTTDEDLYAIDLADSFGSRLDVVLGSVTGQPLSLFTMQLLDPSNTVVATATPNFGGAAVANYSLGIQDFLVTSAGMYTVRITADQSTPYSLVVTDQLVFDTEPNDTTARSLDNVDGALGLLASGAASFTHYNDPSLFIDISGTGTALGLSDDAEATVTTSVGNSLLPAGSVTIGNNGVVAQGAGVDVGTGNEPLPTGDFDAALVPFWDDIDADTGNVYWEERLVGGINTLIVQWHERPRFSNVGSATFQVQLFASGPVAARYVYPDVDFGSSLYNFGASATIGVQVSSTEGTTFSVNSPSLANGDVIDIRTTEIDRYAISLELGQTVQLQTRTPFDNPANLPPNQLDPNLTIRDAEDLILVSDSDSGGDGKNAMIDFTAPADGVYFIDVSNDGGSGEYLLLVSSDNTLSGDFNGDGNYDCADIDALTAAIIQGTDLSYDLNGDNVLDLADRDAWLLEAGLANGVGAAYLVGDVNFDTQVDGIDFIVWNAFKFSATRSYCRGDLNMDGTTDGLDFIEWNANKFTSASRPPTTATGEQAQPSARDVTTQFEATALAATPVMVVDTPLPAGRARDIERLFAVYGREPSNEEEVVPDMFS